MQTLLAACSIAMTCTFHLLPAEHWCSADDDFSLALEHLELQQPPCGHEKTFGYAEKMVERRDGKYCGK